MKLALETGADIAGHDTRSTGRDGAQGNGTILVVDDEPGLRRLWRLRLQREGYVVFEAESAKSAMDVWRAQAGDIDLLLTDYNMPGDTGLQLAEALRAEDTGLRVILVSGSCADNLAFPLFVSFLAKPFTLQALSETIDSKMRMAAS